MSATLVINMIGSAINESRSSSCVCQVTDLTEVIKSAFSMMQRKICNEIKVTVAINFHGRPLACKFSKKTVAGNGPFHPTLHVFKHTSLNVQAAHYKHRMTLSTYTGAQANVDMLTSLKGQ